MAGFPKEHVVTVRAELDNAVVVRPGDKLVVGFARRLDMAEIDHIRQRSRMMLPDVEVIIFDDITTMAVYRPEPHYEELPGNPPWKTDADRRKQDRIDGKSPIG